MTLKYDMPVLSLATALPMQDREKFSKGRGRCRWIWFDDEF
jgi:hypothetical protein